MNCSVWIVDDDDSIRAVVTQALHDAELKPRAFSRASALLDALADSDAPGAVITDLRMPGMDGRELVDALQVSHPELPVVVMTAYADLDSSVDLLGRGAFDLLPKPFDIDAAVALVRRALTPPERVTKKATPIESSTLIGEAPAMKQLFRTIGRLAQSELGVLLIGESGTGKERIARALHDNSPRAKGPFIAINVAAIPAELLESELFGHEKGAFSGADQARAGHFERAAGGTLFLDEIGDMPAAMQTRLLRVLAEGDFYRLGATQAQRADVRIISATHQNLTEKIAQGQFREDLYHRLDVVQIHLPALRERREDIGALFDHYLAQASIELGVPAKTVTTQARGVLEAYTWPGNIRELVNLCRRLTALVPGRDIRAIDLPMSDHKTASDAETVDWERALRQWAQDRLAEGADKLLPQALERMESCLIDEALNVSDGQIGEAARRLGIGRNTLARKRSSGDASSD